MNKINQIENISLYFSVFISSIFTQIAYDYIKAQGFADYILVISIFIVFALTIYIVSGFCRIIINQSSVVRRIILRHDYIEGIWIDTAAGRESKSCGLYVIRYADSSYHITGKEFNLKGECIYDWQSMISSFDGDRLVYLYLSHSRIGEIMEENYGITSVTFIRSGPNKFPRISTGYFIDAGTNFRKVATSAQKLSNHNLKILDNLEETKKLIREWITKSGQTY